MTRATNLIPTDLRLSESDAAFNGDLATILHDEKETKPWATMSAAAGGRGTSAMNTLNCLPSFVVVA
jgi:hypothetical protein